MSVIEKAVAILRKDNALPAEVRSSLVKTRLKPDHTINNQNIICELDHEALLASGYLTADTEKVQFAEEYRRIKRPLLANAFGKGVEPVDKGNLVMITSSIGGEGKTFTAINLALSIALERDTTVLLVDADVVKPKLSSLFGLSNQPGLMDVLDNPAMSLADVIFNTDNSKLRIIPSGSLHEQSTEMLSSERMHNIVEELSDRYMDRIVIFDAPPLLMSSQAKVLSGYMGQIMVVVEAGQTDKNAILETTTQLDHDKVVGLILNKCKISKNSGYGGYYGNYGE